MAEIPALASLFDHEANGKWTDPNGSDHFLHHRLREHTARSPKQRHLNFDEQLG